MKYSTPEERAFQMEEKRRHLADHHEDIFMAATSSYAASTETLNLMLKHLPIIRPDLYERNHETIRLKPHSNFQEGGVVNKSKNKCNPST